MEIECLYSCKLCGLLEVSVRVPAREENQDIRAWMEQVLIVGIANNHSLRSPGCLAKVITEICIPITGVKYLGGPAEN
jgi:hypothetical protein